VRAPERLWVNVYYDGSTDSYTSEKKATEARGAAMDTRTHEYVLAPAPPRRPAVAYVIKRDDGLYAHDDKETLWVKELALACRWSSPVPVDAPNARIVKLVRKVPA